MHHDDEAIGRRRATPPARGVRYDSRHADASATTPTSFCLGSTACALMTSALGFAATDAQTQAIWEANALKWPQIGPPWRPSPGDIALYRRFAGDHLAGRTLILGATPELRDLLAEHGSAAERPVVVDQSSSMLTAMTSLLRTARRERESWRVTDWCSVDLPQASFDLVLADMIWWTLPVDRQGALRDRIAELLAPQGRFVSRFRWRDHGLHGTDPADVIDSHLARLGRSGGDEQALRDAMLSRLYDVTVDVAGKRMSRARTHAVLAARRDAEDDEARRAFLDITLTRLIGADWTSQTREEIMPALLERFDVVAETCADDYASAHYPVIALRKRNG